MIKKHLTFFRRLAVFWHSRKHRGIIILAALSLVGQLVYGSFTGAFATTTDCHLVQAGRDKYEAGDFAAAVTAWQQAELAYLAPEATLCRAMVVSNLALGYEQLGKLSEAVTASQKSLQTLTAADIATTPEQLFGLAKTAIQTETNSKKLRVLAQALNTQGKLELAWGKAQIALETWRQALAAYEKAGDRAGVIRSQINQSQALQSIGHYRDAGTILLKVLGIVDGKRETPLAAELPAGNIQISLEKLPDLPSKTAVSYNLANVYLALGDYKSANSLLEFNQKLSRRSPQATVDVLMSLGNVQRALAKRARDLDDLKDAQSRTEQAIAFYQQAQNLANFPSLKITKIQAQLNQLSLWVEIEKWLRTSQNAAGSQWQMAVQTDIQKWVKESKFQLETDLDNLAFSRAKLYAQINLAQSLINLSPLPISDASISAEIVRRLSAVRETAKAWGDNRMESYAWGTLGNLYELKQDLARAEKYTEQARFASAQVLQTEDISYQWQWQLGRIRKEQGKLSEAIALYKQTVGILQTLRENLVGVNAEAQFSFRDNVEPIYRELVDLLLTNKGNAVPNTDVLAEVIDLVDKLQIAEIEQYLGCNIIANSKKLSDFEDPQAAVIYPIILPKRLAIILKLPGSPLKYYETTISRPEIENNLKYLRHYLSQPSETPKVIQYSQKVYEWLIRKLEPDLAKNPQVNTLVFVLDGELRNIPMAVLYDAQKEQYLLEKKYAIAIAPRWEIFEPKPTPAKLNILRGGVGIKQNINDYSYEEIPGLAEELNGITHQKNPSQAILNEKFTIENIVSKLNSDDFSAIHFKTHGVFSSDPDRTFIVGYQKLITRKELGNLIQTDIQKKSKLIDLLVLSACESAQGDKRAVLGLAGIAVQAGARSTISTLWKAQDYAATKLSIQFYQELSQSDITKAHALRKAQLALMKADPAPYIWATYILVGNWL